mmetsp:Transcript_23019/g.54723  ORF Transcript_23019/g.54723 Transcript_23019/m.54723 type:complete len:128 (-) Transcript_23019:713-1096(-)
MLRVSSMEKRPAMCDARRILLVRRPLSALAESMPDMTESRDMRREDALRELRPALLAGLPDLPEKEAAHARGPPKRFALCWANSALFRAFLSRLLRCCAAGDDSELLSDGKPVGSSHMDALRARFGT